MKKVLFTIQNIDSEDFEWRHAMMELEKSLNYRYEIVSAKYIDGLEEWKKNLSFETKFIPIHSNHQELNEGQHFVLVDKMDIFKINLQIIQNYSSNNNDNNTLNLYLNNDMSSCLEVVFIQKHSDYEIHDFIFRNQICKKVFMNKTTFDLMIYDFNVYLKYGLDYFIKFN